MTAFNTLAGLRAAETGDTMPTLTQGWYNKTFLSIAEPALVHDQFGMPATLPKGNGEQVLWRRWSKLAVNTTPVADGITPTGKSLSYVNVVGTVKWYGDWVGITDQVQFMHPDNVLTMATKRLGLQAAETSDTITRDVINAGTGFLRVTADSTNPATGVGARNTVQGVLTKKATDTAVTELEANDAKYFHGKMSASTKISTEPIGPAFVCIIHPYVAHSLINALSGFGDDFVPREKYASGGVAYMTEVGKYRNVRFLTSTRAKFWLTRSISAQIRSFTSRARHSEAKSVNGTLMSWACLATLS